MPSSGYIRSFTATRRSTAVAATLLAGDATRQQEPARSKPACIHESDHKPKRLRRLSKQCFYKQFFCDSAGQSGHLYGSAMRDLRMHLNGLADTSDQAQQRSTNLGPSGRTEFANWPNATNAENGANICHKNWHGYAGDTGLNFLQAFGIAPDLYLRDIMFQLINLG